MGVRKRGTAIRGKEGERGNMLYPIDRHTRFNITQLNKSLHLVGILPTESRFSDSEEIS